MPYKNEKNYLNLGGLVGSFKLVEEVDGWYFSTAVFDECLQNLDTYPISTET